MGGSNPCKPTGTVQCPALNTNFYFSYRTIAVSGSYLYAAPAFISYDTGSLSGSIVRIGLSSGSVQLLAGGGYPAGTSSTYPAIGLQLDAQGLAVDPAGDDVFITGRSQLPSDFAVSVAELSASDNSLHIVAGGTSDRIAAGDGGPATKAGLSSPQGILLSSTNDVVFVDFPNIRSFPVGGNIQTIAGNGTVNFFGDGGLAIQAGLEGPSDVASDQEGNIYFVDEGNNRVRRIDAVTGEITTVAGGDKSTPQPPMAVLPFKQGSV